MLVACMPIPVAEHQRSQAIEEDDVWSQVFAEEDVSSTLTVYQDELAQMSVLQICQAESDMEKLEAIRTLLTISG